MGQKHEADRARHSQPRERAGNPGGESKHLFVPGVFDQHGMHVDSEHRAACLMLLFHPVERRLIFWKIGFRAQHERGIGNQSGFRRREPGESLQRDRIPDIDHHLRTYSGKGAL